MQDEEGNGLSSLQPMVKDDSVSLVGLHLDFNAVETKCPDEVIVALEDVHCVETVRDIVVEDESEKTEDALHVVEEEARLHVSRDVGSLGKEDLLETVEADLLILELIRAHQLQKDVKQCLQEVLLHYAHQQLLGETYCHVLKLLQFLVLPVTYAIAEGDDLSQQFKDYLSEPILDAEL
jgi:hypothetical protein